MDRLDAMQSFVAVAEEGSFTGAANKLKMSNQLVSKYVSYFEDHIGVRLFNRTTRRVNLTQEGVQCLAQVRQILENYEDMKGHLGEQSGAVNGVLRISAPVTFATLHLSTVLKEFKQRYPKVSIDLQLNDRKVDVVDEAFDIALRIGELKSSSLIARKVAPVKLVLCASPDYLTKNGVPSCPNDLNAKDFLYYSYMDFGPSDQPLIETLRVNSFKRQSGFCSNNGELLTAAAIAGQGFALQPTFIAGEAIKQGKLVTILDDYQPKDLAIYVVYPHRKLVAAKLRVFVDFICQYYGDKPYWDDF